MPAPTRQMTYRSGASADPRDMLGRISAFQDSQLAQVYRQDFENYRRRFYPVEDELLGSYRNIGDIREAQQQGLADIGSAFNRATEARDDRIRGLGLALTPRQEEDLNRRSELSKGLAEVEAMNRINRRFVDRDRELLTTGVAPRSSLSQAYGG